MNWISIHALLAESDLHSFASVAVAPSFLSTLSLRRATVINLAAIQSYIFLSTLSLRRATFHPLSVGLVGVFLSTLSLRRATETGRKWLRNAWNFYPRSPCGERRLGMVAKAAQDTDFYPRSPCGERPLEIITFRYYHNFYPRSPCGERLCDVLFGYV